MVRYYKGDPSEFVMAYVKGRLVKEGRGASFFYRPARTSIVSVPLNTADADFVFNEVTTNFQAVVIQGQITYRIADPRKVASLLNYEIHPLKKAYRSEDPKKLPMRLVNLVHQTMQAEIQRIPLEEALRKGADLVKAIGARLRQHPDLADLGVEILNVFLAMLRPTPEVAKALEAEYRESLLKRADQAIYDRRATAVEKERKIRENELGTEIALEQERERLVDLKNANLVKESEAAAKAAEAGLAPYRSIDPRILLAMAFKSLGENASKIGNLTITPDLLATLMQARNG